MDAKRDPDGFSYSAMNATPYMASQVGSRLARFHIEEVRLVPVEGKLELELAGDLAGILALTSNNPRRAGRGLQVTLVAGVRNHLDLLLSTGARPAQLQDANA